MDFDPCEGCRHLTVAVDGVYGAFACYQYEYDCARMDDLPEDYDGTGPCPCFEPWTPEERAEYETSENKRCERYEEDIEEGER